MAESNSTCTRLLVAAIDFGTTYSGYAFSFRDRPDHIETNASWVSGSGQFASLKCPTSVLLKPCREFHSFGYEAENKYAELAEDDIHHDWYLFRRFKMVLYETKDLRLNKVIEDISGKTMPAIDVIAHSIRFLKGHLLSTIKMSTTGILETDIQYIITVPAIWDEKAKVFMRKAANKADIPNAQIAFALEPEAASIWCQELNKTQNKHTHFLEPLTKYMVVDLGGGTADITVHQKMKDGSLKELHKASGGAWGGNEVDKAYLQMLTDIVGTEAMGNFQKSEMADHFDLLRDFEMKKRTITKDTDGKIIFRIPASLRKYSESDGIKLQEKIASTKFEDIIKWIGDKARIEKSATKALFDIPLEMLINHIKELFTEPKLQDVRTILLVGGFGECELVKAAFEHQFPQIHLKVPTEAGLAVLKGAVIFGHLPDIVATRIARFTIGREWWPKFKDHHDPDKKVKLHGIARCKYCFKKVVEVGEEIPIFQSNETVSIPAHASNEYTMIRLFSSTKRNVMYTTEKECQELGYLLFKLPESSEIEDKKFVVTYHFGKTEIHVHVRILKTNEEHETWIEYFSDL